MPKHPKLTNLYAANQQVIGVAVQSNKVYLPRMKSSPFACIASRQINAIR
jgi:hypothetical protein